MTIIFRPRKRPAGRLLLQLFGKGADFFGNFSLFAVHLQGQAEDHAADFLFRQDLADFGQIFSQLPRWMILCDVATVSSRSETATPRRLAP